MLKLTSLSGNSKTQRPRASTVFLHKDKKRQANNINNGYNNIKHTQ